MNYYKANIFWLNIPCKKLDYFRLSVYVKKLTWIHCAANTFSNNLQLRNLHPYNTLSKTNIKQ